MFDRYFAAFFDGLSLPSARSFAIGVTMVAGVLAGYVSAMLVVPSLHRWLDRREVATR